MKQTLVLVIAIMAAACTTVDYTSQSFESEAAGHRSIAVLPFEMVLTGRAPAGLTNEQIARIENSESLAFQTALYHAMLDRSSVSRKNPILIDIQPVDRTNRLLDERGIRVRDSWSMSPGELAEVLGVDAVVRTTVQKTRYLSGIESLGIEAATGALLEATEGRIGWMVPFGVTATDSIHADSALLSADDGDVLWKVVVESATDWRISANDAVLSITRKLAKKFPYRA